MSLTTNRQKELTEMLETYRETGIRLTELKNALTIYSHKNIDARFFKTYFTRDNGTTTYTKYDIFTPNYGPTYRLFVSRDHTVALESRATDHVRTRVAEDLDAVNANITRIQDELTRLETFDEEALVTALREVYKTMNPPETLWREVLLTFAVKYPND